MKRYRIVSIILAFILILTGALFFKQHNQLKKVENIVFDVAISNTISKYNISSLEQILNEVTQNKVLSFNQDGSSNVERDIQGISSAYRELYQYYVAYDNQQIQNNFQETLQEFQTFFDYLGVYYKQDFSRSNEDEALYSLTLKDEAMVGVDLIATMMQDLAEIQREVYKDKATGDREAWKSLIINNENYALTAEVQQNREKIQQLIQKWSQ